MIRLLREAVAALSTAVRFLFLAVLLGGLALAFGLSLLAPGKAKPSLAAYPSPVPGQVVYDTAEVLDPQTEAQATATIQGIAARTGAQVIVYTQVKPESDTPEAAQADADALGTQWGVGRKGFDDGLVILFDLDESKCHGQVQLDAGSGYAAAFLSNDERQQIYEDDMLPLLRDCDLDGALLTALAKVDANATPDHARNLTLARQANAVVGLLGAPIVFLALAGWAFFHWRRYGRDPVYLDDPSILMPAPPPDLTAAGAALLIEGRSTRRALTTALVDLASRGRIAFEPQQHLLGKENVAIHVLPEDTRPSPEALRARRGPSGEAEAYVLGRLQSLAGEGGLIEPDELLALGKDVGTFDSRLEATAVGRGWFSQPPTAATRRWTGYGVIELVGAALVLVGGLNVPSSGLVLLAVGLGAAGIVTLALGQVMPARTMAGAMIRSMLAAYRRTLEKTMEQARSMGEVVERSGLSWLETPDRALVWSVALGLAHQAEQVLQRSAEDIRDGRASATTAWIPGWYAAGSGSAGSGGGGGGGLAPGLLAGSAVPSFSGMFSALGTIGNAPSSSSGGGGGGGGGGFGGGGAGGGF